jgi:ATP-dependent RNA helicase RhlE
MPDHRTEPASGFTKFPLSAALRRGVAAAGFTEPRPIQAQTIPAILEGRDVLGLAHTGTGKTAAFAVPLLERVLARPGPGPRVLIVAPTRELAGQIAAEIRTLAGITTIQVATVFGGVSAQAQRAALRMRPEILVACPGRLLDLLRQGAARLDRIETLVLDEADHMFDLGFLPDVRRILAALPERRQTLLFCATLPGEIRVLAGKILRDPHVVELSRSTPAATIEHELYATEDAEKLGLLQRLLAEGAFTSAIVFTRTKRRARRPARQLSTSGRRAVALQGDMSQNQRERAMTGFRRRQFDILVATDIAARGIDVEWVSHVVNFDMPATPDAYTHRIGRTGRAEREGKAYTFVTGDDHALVRAVEDRIGAPITRRSGEAVADPTPPRRHKPRGRGRPAGAGAAPGRGRTFDSPAGAITRDPGAAAGPVVQGEPPCGNFWSTSLSSSASRWTTASGRGSKR